jgi:hypothetical protein
MMNTRSAIILGVFLVISGAIAGYLARSQYGRYQVVQREDNRIMVIDTATGRAWDSMPERSWVEYPQLPAGK